MEAVEPKRPRVLLIHNFLSPYRIPLFRELATRFDLDVWILGDIQSVREWSGDVPDPGFRYRVLPRLTIPLGSRYNIILVNYTLPFALAQSHYDAIVCCAWDTPATFYTALHAHVTRTPFILWSGSTPAEPSALRSLTTPLVRTLIRTASAWLAYGTRAKDYLVSLGADAERTYLAYNTVEIDTFAASSHVADERRNALRQSLNIQTPHTALYCGNLLDLKGVPDLLDAFATVAQSNSDVTLLLVGAGENRANYETQSTSLGITDRVRFTGFVPREKLSEYYAIADVLIVPSRSEVWGLVINEALACGIPVIATDICGAVADLLTDGENGFIVPTRNPKALSDALHRYFAPETNREAMREATRRSIAPFTISRTADAFVAAVRAAMESR